MPTITFRVSDELAAAIDEARGELGRSDWLRALAEERLGAPDLPVAQGIERRVPSLEAAGSTPARQATLGAKAGRSPMPDAANVARFRARIATVITGSFRTPRQISEETGLPERIVEKMLGGMDVEWVRGAVRLR